jgi:hypothetical protein
LYPAVFQAGQPRLNWSSIPIYNEKRTNLIETIPISKFKATCLRLLGNVKKTGKPITHIILWSVVEPEKLLPEVLKELESKSNELWYSPISVWEIHLLAEKGHISLGSH